MPGIQALHDRQVWQERIHQLEAQVQRLQGALISAGMSPRTVEYLTHGESPSTNIAEAVPPAEPVL